MILQLNKRKNYNLSSTSFKMRICANSSLSFCDFVVVSNNKQNYTKRQKTLLRNHKNCILKHVLLSMLFMTRLVVPNNKRAYWKKHAKLIWKFKKV